jgi:S-adenosylmethionine-diacylglycerol 3-amino-3-carboxypropyl transferase
MKAAGIEQRADWGFIRYGMVWEDADVLCAALKPVARGRRLLSIASAGGNSLALLSLDPREVLAVDLNPAQLACLDLRMAAMQGLEHGPLLAFLGVTEYDRRLQAYGRLRKRLQSASRDWWDGHRALIEAGIIHAGKLERFLRGYRWLLHRLVHPPERVRELLSERDAAGRANYVESVWKSRRWRWLNRLAFSRRLLGRLGRDPEFFRHAGKDVTSGPNGRLDRALASPRAHLNPYLTYHLTGSYSPRALPLYLRPGLFKALRRRLDRVRLHLGPVESAPGSYGGFNLSNIFEYMAPAQHQAVYGALLAKALPRARLAYWNLHVERACPPALRPRVRPLRRLSTALHRADQAWAYRAFHVDAVRP